MKAILPQLFFAFALCLVVTACTKRAPNITLHTAVERGDLKSVRAHVAAGTDLNAKNDAGWAALHVAAMNGNQGIVEALVSGGADPTIAGPQGRTALDLAAERGHSAVVAYLQAQGEARGRQLIDGGVGVSETLDLL